MVIYIEYAFIENFLFDYCLLYLSLKAARLPVYPLRLLLSGVFGAAFALLFPLLSLSAPLAYVLKFFVGFLLCLLVQKRVKTKKEWGRYALNVVFFFMFSFGFGGVLLGALQEFFSGKVPSVLVMIGFAILTAFSSYFVKKLYKKRVLHRFIYDCRAFYGEKCVEVGGFLDSGNLAIKNGLPVCFLCPDKLYELIFDDFLDKGGGQVCDEITISTLGGDKTLPLYKGELEVATPQGCIKKQVYFAASTNMLSREYEMILSGYVFEESIGVE